MNDDARRERGSALRVLIVEDETLVALILEDMLVELGHEIVGMASTLSEGLEMAERRGIDIAILDLNLKGASSLPIANALRARGVPIAFSTGYGRGGLPESFSDAPLLQKPFQLADIEAVIAEAGKVSSR